MRKPLGLRNDIARFAKHDLEVTAVMPNGDAPSCSPEAQSVSDPEEFLAGLFDGLEADISIGLRKALLDACNMTSSRAPLLIRCHVACVSRYADTGSRVAMVVALRLLRYGAYEGHDAKAKLFADAEQALL